MRTYLKRCRWGEFLLIQGDMISEYVNLYGEWSEGEVEVFRRLLPEDGVVIEVGSNIGMHAVPLSQFCARGRVFCYEPQRVIFQILCANLALNNLTNVVAQPCAVGDKNTFIEIEGGDYDRPWNYGAFSVDSGFNAESRFTGDIRKEQARLLRLDDDPLLQNIQRLDFLKIDAEGYECDVMNGAKRLIKKFQPMIFAEVTSSNNFDHVWNEMLRRGYRCYWVCSQRARKNNFNQAQWLMPGQDTNLLGAPQDRPQPGGLVEVKGAADLQQKKVPLY